ncbi:MAG: FkbM family methyltransferase [Cyanobacteria bacterium J06600_6]
MIKPDDSGRLNQLGKILAKPLSTILVNPLTEDWTRLLEAYWCILTGKGAGTGWDLNSEIAAARSVIKTASPTIFDVGANNGEWSLLMSQLFPQAQLYLFEPQPDCQQTIVSKQLPNMELVPYAVSSSVRQTKIYTTAATSGIASLHPRQDTYFEQYDFFPLDIQTITLDRLISDRQIEQVDFLKMDIEGHELDALKGAQHSLESKKIKALSFEFGSGNINSRTFFRDFWDLLHPYGYQIYRILPSARLMRIDEYYEDCEYFRGVTNYLAVLTDPE